MGLEPVVVDSRQQVAPVAVDSCPEVIGTGRRILDSRFELGDVKADGSVRLPPNRPMVERDVSIGVGQDVPDRVQLAPQVRQCLRIAGFGPERECDLLASQRPVAVQDQVCEQSRVTKAVDPLTVERDTELSEEIDLELCLTWGSPARAGSCLRIAS